MSSVRREVPTVARDFQGHRAGIVTRCLACAVDVAVVAGAVLGLWIGWVAARFVVQRTSFTFPSPTLLTVILAGGAVAIVYLTVFWATTGRSIGGQVLGLRVVNFRGNRVGWVTSFLRAAFCVFFPIGLAWILISPRNRSVQDVALQTSVIYDWTTRPTRRAQ